MKAMFITVLIVCSPVIMFAQESARIKALEEQVQQLEKRLEVLEKRVAVSQLSDAAKEAMKAARERVAKERETFSAEDILNAENIYQRAAKMMADERSKAMLDSVVTMYPKLNRAGCAQLYRAQQEGGAEKERLLKDCIARFSNCYYLDGTQVGPDATLQLAGYYEAAGRIKEAEALYRSIRAEFPKAVGHDGVLLVNKFY